MSSPISRWIGGAKPEALVLALALGFALGIPLFLALPSDSTVFFALILALVFLSIWLLHKKTPALIACVLLIGVVLGVGRTALVPRDLPEAFMPLIGAERVVEGIVVHDPDVRETNQRLTIQIQQGEVTTKLLVVAPLYPAVRYGEHIRAAGTIERPEPFESDGGRTFRYDEFLEKDGVFLIMERASHEVVAPRDGALSRVRGALSDLKFAGIEALGNALPEPHASLAGGLILGGKQGLGGELLDDFIAAGLVHIVVLSGYNVMIVAEFVMRLLGNMSRRFSAIAGIVAILAFVIAAGAGAASVRAGIMAGIAVFGRATGRTYDAFRALIGAGLLMLLINPLSLVYDPGFQLSFVATLGLIFGAPLVLPFLDRVRSEFLREIMASTIAAQISVLPLLLYQNGLFSVVALPANLLVLPTVPLAMLLSALAGLGGFLFPWIAPLLGLPAYALLSYIIAVVEFGAGLPLASFVVPSFPSFVVFVSYVLLAALAWQLYTKRPATKGGTL